MVILVCVEFSEWINRKFLNWRGERSGQSASIAEFAKQFGAPQQLVSSWMKPSSKGGKVPRAAKYINALVDAYGEEAYSVLGLVKPDEEIVSMDQLVSDDRVALESALREAGFPVNAETDLIRVIKALEAHGIKVTRKR